MNSRKRFLTTDPVDAIGNKFIHPYSDFPLHDIGTGDGISVRPDALDRLR